MMEEEGRVVKVEAGYAIVHTERGSACDSCSSKASCHALGGTDGKVMEMRVVNDIGAVVGDRVKIAIDSVVLLKSSFLIYIVPLVFMIAGGIIGDSYAREYMPGSDPDLVAGGAGIVCLVISFLLIKLWSKGLDKKREYQPRIVAILNREPLTPGT